MRNHFDDGVPASPERNASGAVVKRNPLYGRLQGAEVPKENFAQDPRRTGLHDPSGVQAGPRMGPPLGEASNAG